MQNNAHLVQHANYVRWNIILQFAIAVVSSDATYSDTAADWS